MSRPMDFTCPVCRSQPDVPCVAPFPPHLERIALAAPKAPPADPAQQATKGESAQDKETRLSIERELMAGARDDLVTTKLRFIIGMACGHMQKQAAALAAQQAPAEPAEGTLQFDARPLHEQIAEARRRERPTAELLNTIVGTPQPAAPVQPSTKVEREGLTLQQLNYLARDAQIDFCMNKESSFEVAFARRIEAEHGIPAPTAGEKGEGK